MSRLKLLFGVHNHQPVGNFGHVFEEVFHKCYQPYFEILKQFPKLKTAVHFTGPLLEWLQEHQPDYLKMLRGLAESGRLEILGGGFYEPILSTLPEGDAVGQIEMMSDFVETTFGVRPRGLWLAERIWSPDLPRILNNAGIEYTILDDTHFYYSGLEEEQIHGYYITENQGHPVNVFPISKTLRYSIPFEMPEKTLEYLKKYKEESGFDAVTYADDGEKFGCWPETYEWVYKKGYLKNLFTALEGSSDWLETVTFGEYVDREPPTGRVYLPMASYHEMMEWALPPAAAHRLESLKETLEKSGMEEEGYRTFLRGGQWDHFLTKYEESNIMHKKMLYVSRKVARLPAKDQKESGALRELYRGQCNCAQWHGLFGGLYLNYLRHALYNHLIAAENIADRLLEGEGSGLHVETLDFTLDGHQEVMVRNSTLTACIAPAQGGALIELDFRPLCFNLSNVLRRRPEAYHQKLLQMPDESQEAEGGPQSIHDSLRAKEEGLQDKLFYDAHQRYSFIDRFLPVETTWQDMKESRFEELGNFVGQPYAVVGSSHEDSGKPFALKLRKEGRVLQGGEAIPVVVEKEFSFEPDGIGMTVTVTATNKGKTALKILWGQELNFTLLAGDAPDRYYVSPALGTDKPMMNSEGALEGVDRFGLRDDYFKLSLGLEWEVPESLWRFPVETVSQSEDGFERTYQGSCLFAFQSLQLDAGSKQTRVTKLALSQESI